MVSSVGNFRATYLTQDSHQLIRCNSRRVDSRTHVGVAVQRTKTYGNTVHISTIVSDLLQTYFQKMMGVYIYIHVLIIGPTINQRCRIYAPPPWMTSHLKTWLLKGLHSEFNISIGSKYDT